MRPEFGSLRGVKTDDDGGRLRPVPRLVTEPGWAAWCTILQRLPAEMQRIPRKRAGEESAAARRR